MGARPYALQMQRVLGSLAARVDTSIHPLLATREPSPEGRSLVIVVSGDKGLCGSFNTNVIKSTAAFITSSPQPCSLGLVGRKGRTVDHLGTGCEPALGLLCRTAVLHRVSAALASGKRTQ